VKTPRISTYIYAIVAGPFDYYESIVDGLPLMRIYARASLKKDINHEEMFLVTQAGMRYYKDLFGKEYPFGKYD
jgi:aminopeptidase N